MNTRKHLSEKFVTEVNALVENYNVSVMDAIVHYCERHNLEIETIAPIVKSNSKIKSLLQEEAEKLNFLEKTTKLPL